MHHFFFGFLTLQGIFYQNLRIFLNRIDQFTFSSAGSSGQLHEVYPNPEHFGLF